MPLSTPGRGSTPALGNQRQGGSGRTVVICGLISLVLFTVSCRMGDEGPLATLRSAFQTVTYPVRYLGSAISVPFQSLGNVVTNLTADQETLTELQAEVEELRAKNVELEEDAQTAERLQELLDLQDVYNLQSTAAHIISESTDSWSATVTIDKGTLSGLTVGMPVTSSSGILGQIIECSASTSTVRLITDENSSVSAMLQSTRVQGMVEGSVDGQLYLTLIPSSSTVEVGDVVVTSGLGGVFPKGLPIGEVTSVESTSGASYLTITVEPYSSAENNEEVLVITSLTEEKEGREEDGASADAQDTSSATATEDDSDDEEDDTTEEGE